MADRVDRIFVADSHWMDCAVKKLAKKKKGSGKPKKVVRQTAVDESFKARMRIEAAIRSIPRGKVSTYGAVARAAGIPRGGRLAARVLRRGFGLPWQRVLGAGGEIKLRGDSAIEQRLRLEAEGVIFRGKKVDMKQCECKFKRKAPRAKS